MSETDDVSSSAYAQHLYHLVAYARYNKVYQHNFSTMATLGVEESGRDVVWHQPFFTRGGGGMGCNIFETAKLHK